MLKENAKHFIYVTCSCYCHIYKHIFPYYRTKDPSLSLTFRTRQRDPFQYALISSSLSLIFSSFPRRFTLQAWPNYASMAHTPPTYSCGRHSLLSLHCHSYLNSTSLLFTSSPKYYHFLYEIYTGRASMKEETVFICYYCSMQ